ncbi:hypothetical protein HY449_03260 [Candidatus Pacearchaeota archaeon]|nr:hypothetical protein [Candidatus Pacearchaeota archaeon]
MAFGRFFWFLICLAFGGYLINYSLQFYPIDEVFSGMNKYAILIAGALLILGGINRLLARKHGNSE